MKLIKIYRVLLFALVGLVSILPLIGFVLGDHIGDGGGP